jgi:hypothetical protein
MQPRGVSELRDSEQNETRSASAEDFAEEMKELHSQVKERLQNSSQEYKCRADQHKRQLQFEVGDLILAHLRKERFPKGTYNRFSGLNRCQLQRIHRWKAYWTKELEKDQEKGIL